MKDNNNMEIKTEKPGSYYRMKDAKLAILFNEWIIADNDNIKNHIAKRYTDRLNQLRKEDNLVD